MTELQSSLMRVLLPGTELREMPERNDSSPFPLCLNRNTSANVQKQNSFPLHLTKACQELERDFPLLSAIWVRSVGPWEAASGSFSSLAESWMLEGSIDGAGGVMGLWEDVTDRERLTELWPGSTRHWSSAALAECRGNDLTGAEPGSHLKHPGWWIRHGELRHPCSSLCNKAEELPLTSQPLKSQQTAKTFPWCRGLGG